jgi:GNAT superfamily N-acetyltransferase
MRRERDISSGWIGRDRRVFSLHAAVPRAVEVTTWYLEMTDPAQQAPPQAPAPELEIRRAELPSPELSRYLYAAVGGPWFWLDRLGWTWERWTAWLDRPELETWVAYVRGTPAGFAELELQRDAVELASFGLLPQFVGRGHGPRLLDAAVRRAWELGRPRVWLHTCSLDSPAARATYERRGFRLYDTRTHRQELPDEPPGPWPGARRPPPVARPRSSDGPPRP